jgi:hypothetical protein
LYGAPQKLQSKSNLLGVSSLPVLLASPPGFCITGSVDVGVNPGSEAGFDLSYPEIPKEPASKVKNIEVKAYNLT